MKAATKPIIHQTAKLPSSTPRPFLRENSASTAVPTAYSTPMARPSARRRATRSQTPTVNSWSRESTTKAIRFQVNTGRRPYRSAREPKISPPMKTPIKALEAIKPWLSALRASSFSAKAMPEPMMPSTYPSTAAPPNTQAVASA
ncbi:hypothetical protein AAIH25_03255 [Arthrobacter crystallopoietes]